MAVSNPYKDSKTEIPTTLLLDQDISSDAIRVYAGLVKIQELNALKGGAKEPIQISEIRAFYNASTKRIHNLLEELIDANYVISGDLDQYELLAHECVFDPSQREFLFYKEGKNYEAASEGLSSGEIGEFDYDSIPKSQGGYANG